MAVNPDDLRLGDILSRGDSGDVVLLGFPYEEGVRRNGGRIGAAAGPATLRKLMQRVGPVTNVEYGISIDKLKLSDAGDIPGGLTLEEGHSRLRAKVGTLLAGGALPFVVGGGNDQSFPNGLALLDQAKGYEDGKAHSGSPFRQLLEDSRFSGSNFLEFAAQGNQCSAEHAAYVRQKGGKIVWLNQLKEVSVGQEFKRALDTLGDDIFVSFDIDSISGADCPGVSAPGVRGLSAQDALDICLVAGSHPRVRLFDLSEYNPTAESYRTGKLVATMFYYFCLGVATRKQSQSQSQSQTTQAAASV